MINDDTLIEALARDGISRTEKMLCLIAALEQPATVKQIREKGVMSGLPQILDWNVSSYLAKSHTEVRKLPAGWQLTETGWESVRQLGISTKSPLVGGTAKSLRGVIDGISDIHRKEFLSDALLCFDKGAHRPAVVYSWVGAAWILQQSIVANHKTGFNAAGAARFNKGTQINFRPITTVESFGRLQEADMLQLMEDIGVISKSFHKQLKQRLDLRNGCGHPSTIMIDEHTCAAHIHFLIDNVYKRF